MSKTNRVLLIAYEYPPILSAQSIRWYYLTKELNELGVAVDVLTINLYVDAELSLPVENKGNVFRTFPGPFIGFSSALAKWKSKNTDQRPDLSFEFEGKGLLNRIYCTLRSLIDFVFFPNVTIEWLFFAKKKLSTINIDNYDAIICSHEPATSLLVPNKGDVMLIADLGDPIRTVYSPKWRDWLDKIFERKIYRKYDKYVTTTESLRNSLINDFSICGSDVITIPQGSPLNYVTRSSSCVVEKVKDIIGDSLTLCFFGNLYKEFRNPSLLLSAIDEIDNVKLLIIGSGQRLSEESKNVIYIPKVSHTDSLAIQRLSPILLNISNLQSSQVPGKFYEYLASARPILNLYHEIDVCCQIIEEENIGINVRNSLKDIRQALDKLSSLFESNEFDKSFSLYGKNLKKYSWKSRAELYIKAIYD